MWSTSGGSIRPRTGRCRRRCRPLTQPVLAADVVDPVRGGLSQCRVDEVVDLVFVGSPAGSHSRPAVAKLPISSFFLVSTLITGSPAARNCAGLVS